MKTFHFYIDDSGTRHPDAMPSSQNSQFDWFALGGVIVADEHEANLKEKVAEFKNRWTVVAPLHSHPIRLKKKDFAWLKFEPERCNEFLNELSILLREAPVIGHACVIDRPSYDRRYLAQYGKNRWSLCKTTFTIAVERAAKFAYRHGARLRVYVERSSKPDEKMLREYYDSLRNQGNPFESPRFS